MELAKRLRKHISGGDFAFGTFVVEIRSPAVAQFLTKAGFHFMLIDNEHGYWDPSDIAHQLDAAKRWQICPMIRVSGPERGEIMRALDAGAEAVMIPMVRSVQDLKLCVDYSKYPPIGQRGIHFARPHSNFTSPADAGSFMRESNEKLLTIVQIETVEAVESLDELAAVPGIDALYVGPGDLSVAMGVPGQADHPKVMSAVEKLVDVCRKNGKLAGCHSTSPSMLGELQKRGVQFSALGGAVRMLQWGIDEMGSQIRKELNSEI